MGPSKKIHVLDCDTARRAQISYELSKGPFKTQIYDGLAEFREWPPEEGLILLHKDNCCPIEDLQRCLKDNGKSLPIAVYSHQPSTIDVVQAMLAGALDYLEWPIDPTRLGSAFDKIEDVISPRLQREKKEAEAASLVSALSEREIEVLRLMVAGESNKGIGSKLKISPRTVEIHRANVLTKVNARSSSDAVRVGIYAGLDR